jgi:hypothetical protein
MLIIKKYNKQDTVLDPGTTYFCTLSSPGIFLQKECVCLHQVAVALFFRTTYTYSLLIFERHIPSHEIKFFCRIALLNKLHL